MLLDIKIAILKKKQKAAIFFATLWYDFSLRWQESIDIVAFLSSASQVWATEKGRAFCLDDSGWVILIH